MVLLVNWINRVLSRFREREFSLNHLFNCIKISLTWLKMIAFQDQGVCLCALLDGLTRDNFGRVNVFGKESALYASS